MKDANGLTVAFMYSRDDPHERSWSFARQGRCKSLHPYRFALQSACVQNYDEIVRVDYASPEEFALDG